jgi:C-terminal processing protease CtpA/Prc
VGVRIVAVDPGGSAAVSGLAANDIILGVDGVPSRDANSVVSGVHRHAAGTSAVLWVKRGVHEGVVSLLVPASGAVGATAVPQPAPAAQQQAAPGVQPQQVQPAQPVPQQTAPGAAP